MNTLLYYSQDFLKFPTKKQRKLTTTTNRNVRSATATFSNTVADRNALFIITYDSDEALKVLINAKKFEKYIDVVVCIKKEAPSCRTLPFSINLTLAPLLLPPSFNTYLSGTFIANQEIARMCGYLLRREN